MVAAALRYCNRTGISHAEALTGNAADVGLSCRCSVQCHVADNDILRCPERRIPGRNHNQLSSGESLSEAIVCIPRKPDGKSLRNKGSKGLSAAAFRIHHEGILCKIAAEHSGDVRSENGSEGPVCAGHLK